MSDFSKYQQERNKPTPSFLHSIVQANLTIPLGHYRNKYTIVTEIDAKLTPDDWFVVPDFAILPKVRIDYQKDHFINLFCLIHSLKYPQDYF